MHQFLTGRRRPPGVEGMDGLWVTHNEI
jgi:hypothetical protein